MWKKRGGKEARTKNSRENRKDVLKGGGGRELEWRRIGTEENYHTTSYYQIFIPRASNTTEKSWTIVSFSILCSAVVQCQDSPKLNTEWVLLDEWL